MKLIALTEAKYADESQGSLNWFLKNFFEYERDLDTEPPGKYYRVREGLEIKGREYFIEGMDVWTNRHGEQEYMFTTNTHTEKYIPLKDIVVKQVKTIWPKKT